MDQQHGDDLLCRRLMFQIVVDTYTIVESGLPSIVDQHTTVLALMLSATMEYFAAKC